MKKVLLIFNTLILICLFTSCREETEMLTVEFEISDGLVVESIEVEQGQNIERPIDPVKEGFIFDGWYNVLEKWDFTKPIIHDMTLTGYFSSEDAYTFNSYVSSLPVEWSLLDGSDYEAQNSIISNINSHLFEFDYKFDIDNNIIPYEYIVDYSAATNLEDVTSFYAGNDKYNIPANATSKYAYKVTLREDLKWEDGTPINAHDFIYSMKELLNPLFKHYGATNYYDGFGLRIHNALEYYSQGDIVKKPLNGKVNSLEDARADSSIVFNLGMESNIGQYLIQRYSSEIYEYGEVTIMQLLCETVSRSDIEDLCGKTVNQILDNDKLNNTFNKLLVYWKNYDFKELDFFSYEYQKPKIDFNDVGFFAYSDYEFVFILDEAIDLLDENGNLFYGTLYNNSYGFPLFHKELFELCKVEPKDGETLWSTTYCKSLETTKSWGPYKLIKLEENEFTLAKNENWFGYNDEKYEDKYQTNYINYKVLNEEEALSQFLDGKLDYLSLDSDLVRKYKDSSHANYETTDRIYSLFIQSDKKSLVERETNGINKKILSYPEFREALSLAIDRSEFTRKHTDNGTPVLGLFNDTYYYDIKNASNYRNENISKEVICEIYGVDVSKYSSIDEAYADINGKNLTKARELVEIAYKKALDNGDISPNDIVKLTFGSENFMHFYKSHTEYITNAWNEMLKGTSLEGRLETEYKDASNSKIMFINGELDVFYGSFNGYVWNPGASLFAYIDKMSYNTTAWDTDSHMMKFKLEGVMDKAETLSICEWCDCLNGISSAKFDFSSDKISEDIRINLIAALEREVLLQYYVLPLNSINKISLRSYQVEYPNNNYRTFMGFGGISYLTYNYSDTAWEEIFEKYKYNINIINYTE